MLTLKHLYIQNFMSISELDIDFDENEILSICGPNGSGKSALIYAVAFLLTGYRQGESYRNYVKAGCDSSKLILEAYLKGEPLYCEADIIGNKKKGLVQPVKRKTVYKGVTYLNGDHSQFVKSNELDYAESLIFLFQDTGKDIINARPAERASILKKLFKFEFPGIVDKLKEKQELNKTSSIEYNASLNELQNRSFTLQPLTREPLPAAIESWKTRAQEISRNLLQIGEVDESQLSCIESKLATIQKEIRNLSEKRDQSSREIVGYENKILEISKFLESNSSITIKEKLLEKQRDLEAHKKNYKELQERLNNLNQKINIQNFEERELEKQIEIGKSGVCHACGQAVNENHVQKLLAQKEAVNQELLTLKEDVLKLAFDKEDIIGNNLQREIKADEDLLRRVESESKSLESYKFKISSLRDFASERENAINKLLEQEKDLLKERDHYKQIEPLLNQKRELTLELSTLEEKINNAKEEAIKNTERRRNNERIKEEQKTCEKRKEELSEKLNNTILASANTKTAIDIFESSFPSFLVLQATQKLEDYINEIIQKVFPYMRVKLQMQRSGVTFMYTSESSQEEWLPVIMSSGAQKAILSLAYKTSLARLYGVSCIMLDEVDASCDKNAAEIIYKFIASMDTFQQIIFISHRPEARQAVREINPEVVVYTVHSGEYSLS